MTKRYCDKCGIETERPHGVTFTWHGRDYKWGPHIIDLCPEHQDQLATNVREFLGTAT